MIRLRQECLGCGKGGAGSRRLPGKHGPLDSSVDGGDAGKHFLLVWLVFRSYF